MAEHRMLFAGFGGQGVLFMGKVAAYAGLIEGREVSWLPSYGPEMRGGTANCSVCISERPIGSPLVSTPPVLVVMNGPSFDKFIDKVAAGALVLLDSSLVQRDCPRADVRLVSLPATGLAAENELQGIANMVLFGRLLRETGFASLESVKAALQKCVPARKAHLLEHNERAIVLGMES